MPAPFINIYDTTLRDGSQGPGVNFSLSDKLRIAAALDAFGVSYVEGGWPGANPKDTEFFAEMRRRPLSHARLVAFGSTRHPGVQVSEDPRLQALVDSGTSAVTIFGKSCLLHVKDVLQVSPEENLAMVRDTVAFFKANGKEVLFDAEHFFDGYADNPSYALETLQAAAEAGASTLVLCDTKGGALPYDLLHVCQEVRKRISPAVALGIHCHNDSECAVANSLAAVRAGFTLVQGTINGFGERCGNANLCSIIPAIMLKIGSRCLAEDTQLANLTSLSRLVNELAIQRENPRQPYVGSGAFAHKGGMHVNAVSKNAATFEHVDPQAVGNRRQILLSEMSGVSNVLLKAKEQELELPEDDSRTAREILERVKSMEARGYSFEAADASFKLLVRKYLHDYSAPFELDGFRVIIEKRGPNENCLSEATIKLNVNGKTEITAAEGEGPVNALDSALRKALARFFPNVANMKLQDFKVRILDGALGTAAQTQVLMESADARRNWTTVGVSENIVEASWQAILDSVEYFLEEDKTKP